MSDKLREQLQAALEAGIEQFLEWLAIATGKPLRWLRRKEYRQLAAELARLLAEVLSKLEDLANNPDPATKRELAFRLFVG